MHANGTDAAAALAARIAELEAALGVIWRALEETWRPRLLAAERAQDRHEEQIAALVAVVDDLVERNVQSRRARLRVVGGDHAGADDSA